MSLNDATPDFLQRLAKSLPDGTLRDAEPRHLEEPRGRYAGRAAAVAVPQSVEDVSIIVNAANAARVGLVPISGGTGLVGGQTLSEGALPLLLSTERMRRIRGIYPEENAIVVEAGTILADVQLAAAQVDRMFPLSLAAEGSARIGGNLATNAGGVNVLRYGNARDLCLGLEAVLPTGEIWNGLKRLRKDNTGYDLRNLLIGAEGTLGVITAASLKLAQRPAVLATALFVVPSPQAAIELLALSRRLMGDTVSAFELIHRQGFEFLAETMPEIKLPFTDVPEWCVLMELGLTESQDAEVALTGVFAEALLDNVVTDGLIAKSVGQRRGLWALRENIPLANKKVGSISSHDISLPISEIPEFVQAARTAISSLDRSLRVNCFGHLGDGNLHYNVFPPKGRSRQEFDVLRDAIKRTVHQLVHRYEGSFSAEHGVGRAKVEDLQTYGDPTKLLAMQAIKSALDPLGIMNPGAVLPLVED